MTWRLGDNPGEFFAAFHVALQQEGFIISNE
jgi:hypothetical protein